MGNVADEVSVVLAITPSSSHRFDDCHDVAIMSDGRSSAFSLDSTDETGSNHRDVQFPKFTLHACVGMTSLLIFQFGWSVSQLNNAQYHDPVACAVGTDKNACIMFPGHSEMEWTLAVTLWIVGGMVGSLSCGAIADRYGRRMSLILAALLIIAGGVIQAAAPSIEVFILGRFVAGLASGASTALVGGYITEIAPPFLRGQLVVASQISVVIGIFLVSSSFFVATDEIGWRLACLVPVVCAIVFICSVPLCLVESPTWLLARGKVNEADEAVARLFGEHNSVWAWSWMLQRSKNPSQTDCDSYLATHRASTLVSFAKRESVARVSLKANINKPESVFLPQYRRQLMIAIGVATAQQLTGINGVFYYSSNLFNAAGIADARIGGVVVNGVNILPVLLSGFLVDRCRRRTLLLSGLTFMLLGTVGMTFALVYRIGWMTIACTTLYVVAYGFGIGPLAWGIIAELFPDSVRAQAISICSFLTWTSNLTVGISYPHLANLLDRLGFVPFVGSIVFYMWFIYLFLPETLGKTTDEIQRAFESNEAEGKVLDSPISML